MAGVRSGGDNIALRCVECGHWPESHSDITCHGAHPNPCACAGYRAAKVSADCRNAGHRFCWGERNVGMNKNGYATWARCECSCHAGQARAFGGRLDVVPQKEPGEQSSSETGA